MKKIVSLILIFVMTVCLFSGCLQTNSKTAQKPKTPTGANSSGNSASSQVSIAPDNSDITTVIASYDVINSITGYESNEDILKILFGWEDKIDYSQFIKVENVDSNGIIEIQYMNNDKTTHYGWEIKKDDTSAIYTYEFPGDKEKQIIIHRDNINEDNNILIIKTQNMEETKMTNIGMFLPLDGTRRGIWFLEQKKDYLREGLYIEKAQTNTILMEYSEGIILEQHFYDEN